MTILDTLITRFAFEEDKKSKQKVESGFKNLKSKAFAIAGVLGTILGGGLIANRIADASDEALKFADSIGVAVDELDALEFAADRQGGSMDGLRSSLFNMNAKIGEAARGTGEAKTAMEAYDIQLEKADGTIKNSAELLLDLNKTFAGLAKEKQFDIANKFGIDKGTIKLLQTAPEAVNKLLLKARELGVLNRKDALAAAEFNDRLTDMKQALSKIGSEAGPFLFKPLEALFLLIVKGTKFVREHSRFFKVLAGVIGVLSTAFGILKAKAVAAQLSMFAIPLLIAAAIALIALLIDDFLAFMDGQDSFLADALEKWPKLLAILEKVAEGYRLIGQAIDSITRPEGLKNLIKDLKVMSKFALGEITSPINQTIQAMLTGESPQLTPVPATPGVIRAPITFPAPNRVNTVTINNLAVDARGGDSTEIAQNVSTELRNQIQNMTQDVDSTIER